MIVAFLNHKGGVGKTTLALHLAGEWAERGKRVALVDADPQRSALDWSQQRSREGLASLFGVVGHAYDTLHREAPKLARDVHHVVIDGPPRIVGLMRSALLAADLVLIPVQPSPLDGWGSTEMLTLLREARIYRPQLSARFLLNRCGARTIIARETAETLVAHDPPVLTTAIGQRVLFADAAQSGQLAAERCRQSRRPRDRSPDDRNQPAQHRKDRLVTVLTGGCRDLIPAHGPFDVIVADPSYGDTSLVCDRCVNARLAYTRKVAAMDKRAPERIAAVLPFDDGDAA